MQPPRQVLRESSVGQAILTRRRRAEAQRWTEEGKPGRTPYQAKVEVIRDHAARFGPRVFIETGTFQGEMLAAQLDHFDRLLSVELDRTHYENARRRFRRIDKVTLFFGDSGEQIRKMTELVDEPALFWLDAHYSGPVTARGDVDTPISAELDHVLRRPHRDVVLIDDAEDFDGTNGYPRLDALAAEVEASRPDLAVTCTDAIIRILPRVGG